MIFHPGIIALIVSSLITTLMVCFASVQGLRIRKSWDLTSGSEQQLRLERLTYLISSLIACAMALELLTLFLFIYTADALCPYLSGAMCAAGSLYANDWGYPLFVLKTADCIIAGLWLIVNHADNSARDYPLIRMKYLLLIMAAPLFIAETALIFGYFLGLKAEVITSCCGSLFSTEGSGLASELASLPPKPMIWLFFASSGITLALGGRFLARGKGAILFALSCLAQFKISVLALISFVSLYIYELPTHHCPFCILRPEYHYIGYAIYLSLLAGAVCGMGAGLLGPAGKRASLRETVPAMQRKLVAAAVLSFSAYIMLALCLMLFSPFRLFS